MAVMLILCERVCPSSPEALTWAAACLLLSPAPSTRPGTRGYLTGAEVIDDLLTDWLELHRDREGGGRWRDFEQPVGQKQVSQRGLKVCLQQLGVSVC